MTTITIVFSLYSIFRPVLYKYRSHPLERYRALSIVEKHGRSSMDYFKCWPDKSYFFSPNQESFISYGVGRNFALALADPVGPDNEIESIVSDFKLYCHENDWGMGFHQTLPDFLPIYKKLGLRKIKIGDDAITDLAQFSIEKMKKEIRHTVRKLDESGIREVYIEPPVPDEILIKIKNVSDEWLKTPGRRERQFTLGLFDSHYLKTTPLLIVEKDPERPLAFVNLIPSYRKGEATIDLMRRSSYAPNGIMDYLFIKLFLSLKDKGYSRFNLGMAPMSGFSKDEQASAEERAIHYFFQHLNFLFNYRGLFQYKAKFATYWEPRYTIYENTLDLPRMAIALRILSEIRSKDRFRFEHLPVSSPLLYTEANRVEA
jgi:phosphatidylglycerol lysyltransferase